MHKAFWHSEKDNITLSMPIAKVDKERRMVSGFATLDNVDKQSDIVPTEVSIRAFEQFRGNLREMHMPIAVGKVVSFKSDKFYNKDEDKFYNGVYVDAYISKGAQDTWEKVLDGTLTGFSIGGSINDSDKAYNSDMDKEIRVIKDYELHELSLVDNPANQFANIISIQKASNGTNTIEGMATKTTFENVYWSKENQIIRLSKEEDPRSDETWIGFVESNDIDKASVIKGFLKSQDTELGDISKADQINKGGKNMAKKDNVEATEVVAETKVEKSVDTESETVVVDEIVKSDSPEETPAEEAPVVEETPVVEEAPIVEEAPVVEEAKEVSEEVVKSENTEEITPAQEVAQVDLAKAVETVQASVNEVSKSVVSAVEELAAAVKSINEKVAEITKGIDSVKGEITEVKNNVEEFGKRVDAVEDDTAVRKSGDLGGVVQQKIQKRSMWGGRFLNAADLYR
jgi:hypothetical protein